MLSLLYACFIVIWQGLRFTPVGAWWPFELLDIFGLLTFVPLPCFLLFAVVAESRPSGMWLLVPVSVLLWDYSWVVLPQRPLPDGTPLRVMTANLLVSNRDVSRASALIAVEEPDIVALQEVSPPMAAHLERSLREDYPYQVLLPSDLSDGLGIGLLSRYPLHAEPETGWYSHVCGCQRVTVDVSGQTLSLVNAHPPPPTIGYVRVRSVSLPVSFDGRTTSRMIEAALDGIDVHQRPVIVAGDLNTSDRQPMYRRLRRDLLDAYREAGWGLGNTFPALGFEGILGVSVIRIDYILHNASFATRAAWTGTIPGSDHRYVVADLLLR